MDPSGAYNYMIPPLSTVSERSENLEYSAMGSALSRSMRSRHVSCGEGKNNSYSKMQLGSGDHTMLYSQNNTNTMLSIDQTMDASAPNNIVDLNVWQAHRN